MGIFNAVRTCKNLKYSERMEVKLRFASCGYDQYVLGLEQFREEVPIWPCFCPRTKCFNFQLIDFDTLNSKYPILSLEPKPGLLPN